MVNLRIRKDSNESPKKDVGEIDTRSPFRSVKAAASLFGDTISSSATKPAFFNKSKSQPRGGVLDKEAEFHLTQKELGRVKIQVKDAETAANKALPDLEKAMKTLLELKDKIKQVNASKESICEKTEALKMKSMELEEELEGLSRLRGDFESAMEAKLSALKMEEDALCAAKSHSEMAVQISKEIESMKESIEVEKKLNGLRQEKERQGFNGVEDIEMKLEKKNREIEDLKEKIARAKEALSDSERKAYSEHKAFKKIEEENKSLQEEVEGLKVELAEVGKEIAESKRKEGDEQALTCRLQEKLQEVKLVFKETSLMKTKIEKLVMDAKQDKEEAMGISNGVHELQRVVDGVQEIERKMEMVVKEAEEAVLAERNAQNELKILSERFRKNDRDQKKQVLREEYMGLKEKASGGEMKEAAAMAELEELKASKIEAEKQLKESLREIEEMARATEEAFKKAESAELARSNAVKELKRRRQQQH